MDDLNVEIGTKELSTITGLPVRTITNWHRDGIIRPVSRGRWHLAETVKAIVSHLRSHAPELGARGELLTQQARLARSKADAATGATVPAEQVDFLLQEIGGILKSDVMAFPGRLAPEVIGIGEVGEVRQIIDQEARRLLTRIADRLVGFAGELRRKGAREAAGRRG